MKDITISKEITTKGALKKLDLCATKVLFVVDDEMHLMGALTDGDIRRFILAGGDLNSTIEGFYNKTPFSFLINEFTENDLENVFLDKKIEVIPIVNGDKVLVDYRTWDSVLSHEVQPSAVTSNALNDIPVVIMAGGKGTRLKPFTDVLPKPLVPIQEKPIMDWIIEEFHRFGASQFYGTLNYRGKMIEAYYGSIEKKYDIAFKWEDDFFGTAGSLKLLTDEIDGTFIVSNCDIIVKANYEDVIRFHKESGAMMTVVSSIQHHQIPYGVLEFSDGGVVSAIQEKPEYTHAINTGVYVLEKECLDVIPANQFFHITHLMEELIEKGQTVVTYPVNEKEYIDIGQWEEYMSAVENFTF